MKDVFKYARHIRPGDIDGEGRAVRSVHVILTYEDAPAITLPADDVQLMTIAVDSGGTGSMLTHLQRAELSALPAPLASAASEHLNRLRDLVEKAAAWTG
jgi:hypothetical protein